MQNFLYALIQVVHNFGAMTVVATAAAALWLVQGETALQRSLAWLMAIAWLVQAASGTLFGLTTLYFDGQLPDIHGIAVDALLVKLFCVTAGFYFALRCARAKVDQAVAERLFNWRISLMLGMTALVAAAFLRWFS